MGTLVHELGSPGAWPDPRPTNVEHIETHISHVFLGDSDVYKLKKTVDFGFLDFTTLDQRRTACEAEVRLNRRLTEDVYCGVVPVTRNRDDGHAFGGAGRVVDYAVHMRRLLDDVRADNLLSRKQLTFETVARIASRLTAFHGDCERNVAIEVFGQPPAIEQNIRENFQQTRRTRDAVIFRAMGNNIEQWQIAFLKTHHSTFSDRVDDGHIRDGHGDLRLEHIYLPDDGEVQIIDCIEFNERFRCADVAADIAFLSMDLRLHGQEALAEHLLSCCARESDDYGLYGVVDFYESYRAYVRAKVDSFVAFDPTVAAPLRAQKLRSARRHYLLAYSKSRPSLLEPCVVAVGGLIASGKSTAAVELAHRLGGYPVVSSDRIRKRLAGVKPQTPLRDEAWQGHYAPAATDEVYRQLLNDARSVVMSGRPVVLDASFSTRAHRDRARELAGELQVPFHLVECSVPRQAALRRLADRESRPSVSDGRRGIYDAFARRYEPPDETEEPDLARVATLRLDEMRREIGKLARAL